jgi:hypothetical protein
VHTEVSGEIVLSSWQFPRVSETATTFIEEILMKKSVAVILAVSMVVSLGAVIHIVSSESPDVSEVVKRKPMEERTQPLFGTDSNTLSVFPKPRETISVTSQVKSKPVPVVSVDQGADKFLPEEVLSQKEMRLMIEKFGKPTKESLRWIVNDQRHAEFLADLDEKFGENLSKEAREALLESARLLWFRKDMLDQALYSGTINMDSYQLGLRELLRADKEVLGRVLSDEEYTALMGESKTDSSFEPESVPISSQGYSDMTSLFPALRNGDRTEVSSSADVYKMVSMEKVDEVIRINREQARLQRESRHSFLAGDISEREFESNDARIRQEANDRIDAVLSPEQERFLYGASRRWDAMMPEKGKDGEDKS